MSLGYKLFLKTIWDCLYSFTFLKMLMDFISLCYFGWNGYLGYLSCIAFIFLIYHECCCFDVAVAFFFVWNIWLRYLRGEYDWSLLFFLRRIFQWLIGSILFLQWLQIMTGELSLAAVLRMVLGVWPSDLG